MNSFERIAGLLFTGFAVRAAAAVAAVCVAHAASAPLFEAMDAVQATLDKLS